MPVHPRRIVKLENATTKATQEVEVTGAATQAAAEASVAATAKGGWRVVPTPTPKEQ